MDVRKPNFINLGIVVEHDQACSVCHDKHAVFNTNTCVFQPCWDCQNNGYQTLRINTKLFSLANNSIIYAHAKFHEALYVIQNRKSASHKATGKERSDAVRQRKKKVK